MLITVDEAREYANDYESSDCAMAGYIRAAEAYIASGVGPVSADDPEAKLLCGLLVCDMDDVRELTAAQQNSTRLLVESLKLHLKLKGAPVSELDTGGSGGDENAGGG